MKRLTVYVFPLLLAAAPAGCGGDGKQSVTGTVTLDGKPVEEGVITFVRTDGSGSEGAKIKDGSFQAKVPPGKYKIQLNGRKVTGTKVQKGMDGSDETIRLDEELFPAKFN